MQIPLFFIMNSNRATVILLYILMAMPFVFAKAQQGENNPQRGLNDIETPKRIEELQNNRQTTREEAEQMIEESIRQRVDQMKKMLSLTSDQATKIYAIEVELNNIRSEKTRNVIGDRTGQMKILKEMIYLSEEKYKPVLKADQFRKFQEHNLITLNVLGRIDGD